MCAGWPEGGGYTGMRVACKGTGPFCSHLGLYLHLGTPVAAQVRPDPPAGLGDGVWTDFRHPAETLGRALAS